MPKEDFMEIAQASTTMMSKIDITGIKENDLFIQMNEDPTNENIFKTVNKMPKASANLSEYHDECINFNANGNKTAHAMNLNHENLKTKLDEFPINIKNAGKGIDSSKFYLSAPLATMPLHVEDGLLDTINLMVYGHENATKLWLIINPFFSGVINQFIAAELAKLQNKKTTKKAKDLLQKFPEDCSFPLHHNRLLLSTKFLRENNIQFQIIEQKAGDIIYVRPTVYHQIISTGITLAEAINVGSPLWLVGFTMFMTCRCPDSCISYIIPSLNGDDYKIRIRTHEELRQHDEQEEQQQLQDQRLKLGYRKNANKKQNLTSHKLLSFRCEKCEYTSSLKTSLQRHMENCNK